MSTAVQISAASKKKKPWKLALLEEVVPKRATFAGLSYVEPYECDWVSVVRPKNHGKDLSSILGSMYGNPSESHWEEEISEGRVQVLRTKASKDDVQEWEPASTSTVLHQQDRFLVRKHVHEFVHTYPTPVRVLQTIEKELPVRYKGGVAPQLQLLAVDKPAGFPCFGGQGEWHNNTQFVLEQEYNKGEKLYPVHRLDKVTSGLWLVGLNKGQVKLFSQMDEQGLVRKVYLARVRGRFDTAAAASSAAGGSAATAATNAVDSSTVVCELPLAYCNKEKRARVGGAEGVEGGGKAARTTFRALGYNEADDSTLVECTISSGRRHQIRVHLCALGHPIANDETYGGRASLGPRIYTAPADTATASGTAVGAGAGAGGSHLAATAALAAAAHAPEFGADSTDSGACARARAAAWGADSTDSVHESEFRELVASEASRRPWCHKCTWVDGALAGELERPQAQAGVWLHSWKYEVEGTFRAQAPLPPFAADFEMFAQAHGGGLKRSR